ncbi:hypothetical protein V5O48_018124, partial [Marasmius crinis-equi]
MKANGDLHEIRVLLCTQCNREFVASCNPGVSLETICSSSLPSAPEKAIQLELLESETRTLRQYDEQIEEIAETLRRLQSERASLQKRMNNRNQYLSSQRRLPVELWRPILLEACYPVEEEVRYKDSVAIDRVSFLPIHLDVSTPRMRVYPLLLSRVCHQWRRVIFDFPAMWSSIGLNVYWLSASTLPMLESFLMKTRGQPLRLRIEGDADVSKRWGDGLADDIRIVLCQVFSQSQHLELPFRFLGYFDFQGQTLSFPLLQSLSSAPAYDFLIHRPFTGAQLSALLSAPSLTRLIVPELGITGASRLPSTITSFECTSSVDIEDVDSIADAFPSLKELKLSLVDYEVSEERTERPLVFPFLESLEIQSGLSDPADLFLNRLSVPSLTTLSLGLDKVLSGEDDILRGAIISALVGCLERSECSLRSLSLSSPYDDLSCGTNYDTKWISDILRLSPHLTSLDLTMILPENPVDIPNSTFYRLWSLLTISSTLNAVSVDDNTFILPRLHTVKFEIVNHAPVVENEDVDSDMVRQFLRMVESRTRRTVPPGVDALECAELACVTMGQPRKAQTGLDEMKGVQAVDEL